MVKKDCVSGLSMVNNVCCDTIGLRIKCNTCGISPHNAMGLFFLCMTLKVWDSNLDMVDHVASSLPMDRHYITTLLARLCFVVVIEKAFWFSDLWFHWTCRIPKDTTHGKGIFGLFVL